MVVANRYVMAAIWSNGNDINRVSVHWHTIDYLWCD